VCACAVLVLVVMNVWRYLPPLWTSPPARAQALEASNPQTRSEGVVTQDKDTWRAWQVLQDTYQDILPPANAQDAFLTQRRLIAMHYALRDYAAVIDTATQALRRQPDRLLYRYRSAAYDALGEREQALQDVRCAARLGDEEASRRLWAIGERDTLMQGGTM
jgi:tetratricopeptide (TPR) repeat protein